MIFTFGSNLAGIHGAGAARFALHHEGAVWGRGEGHYGNSYALPTKDQYIKTLTLGEIQGYVNTFIQYAEQHPDLQFQVTRVGCGLAGLRDSDIAPMFKKAPSNCFFDRAWERYLPNHFQYWGGYA